VDLPGDRSEPAARFPQRGNLAAILYHPRALDELLGRHQRRRAVRGVERQGRARRETG
jgi:hypothetical protein